MAKRRSRNEDDEDDDDRPRRRRPRDDDDDDDDDDAPRKRRKSRDDDDEEEEEDRPRRRKSRDDDDDEDDRPRRRRSADDDDDDDDAEDLDEMDEPGEEKSYEEQLLEITKKKAQRRKQLETLSEGLGIFRKQINLVLYFAPGGGGFGGGMYALARIVFGPDMLLYLMILPAGLLLALLVAIPVLQFKAVQKCKQGPSRSDPGGLLTIILAVSFGSALLLPILSVLQSIYFRNVARYFKNKDQASAAHSIMLQHIYFGFGSPIVIGAATFFLLDMGTLGYILIGTLGLVFVLLLLKVYVEMAGITTALNQTIARTIKAEESIDW